MLLVLLAHPLYQRIFVKVCDRALLVTAHLQNALMGPASDFFGLGALIDSKMR
jgi:hypothetical protein